MQEPDPVNVKRYFGNRIEVNHKVWTDTNGKDMMRTGIKEKYLTMYVYFLISVCLSMFMNVKLVNQYYRRVLKFAYGIMYCVVATKNIMQGAVCLFDARYTECDAIT